MVSSLTKYSLVKTEVFFLVKTYYNKKYKKRNKNHIPYQGYQDPNEIDWSVYGPDRPGKRPKPDEEFFFSSIASDTQIISVASFFGLLLPGILGSLYFLGVPLTQVGFIHCGLEMQMHFQVYLAGVSLLTMYFLTGESKALEDESLTTEVLMNILQLIDAVSSISETIL